MDTSSKMSIVQQNAPQPEDKQGRETHKDNFVTEPGEP